jgi:hypothetical protein
VGVTPRMDTCLSPLTTQQAKLMQAMNVGRAIFSHKDVSRAVNHRTLFTPSFNFESSHTSFANIGTRDWGDRCNSNRALDISAMKERKVIFEHNIICVVTARIFIHIWSNVLPSSSGQKYALGSEDGGSTFLRNIGKVL